MFQSFSYAWDVFLQKSWYNLDTVSYTHLCGIWDSVEDACDQIIQEERVYHPDPMHKPTYDELLARYKHLMECLEPVFQ